MPSVVREALLDALAVLLPVECAGCGAPDRALCGSCRARLVPDVVAGRLADGTPVYSGLAYDGCARRLLLALKEDGRTGAAAPLAEALAVALRAAGAEHPEGDLEACAVPSTRSARRRRGYDPVAVLLARTGVRGARIFAPAREHRAQKSLGIAARSGNLEGVFRLRADVSGRRLLLVDDVVTTGATLLEAARVLRAGGAEVVAAVTVAATPRRSGARNGRR